MPRRIAAAGNAAADSLDSRLSNSTESIAASANLIRAVDAFREDQSRSENITNDKARTSGNRKEYRMKTARPYRSHKYPACTRCHKRRSRCTIEIPGAPCLLCRMHSVPCSAASAKKDEALSPKIGFIHKSLLSDLAHPDNVSHVVGPVLARDTQILESYLSPMAPCSNDTQIQGASISKALHKPIYHITIPPRRPSLSAQCSCVRNLPLELISQVDSYFEKLVGLYFEHLYPAFPILEERCLSAGLNDKAMVSRTLLVNFIAYVLFYWNLGPELMLHAKADQDFAWQVAVQSLTADVQKGNIAIVISIVLNVAGRPSKGFVSNMTSVARAVALSHSCGLNHDCREWKLTELEKKLRWKAWWAVLIHDRWLNFAQGTPPYVIKAHYDVPLPTIELLASDRINILKHYKAAECYIELCRLTEIIGDILPLIHHIRSSNDNLAADQISRSETELDEWCHSRPKWIDYNTLDNRPEIPGLANLQLSYLATRMLLQRLSWHEASRNQLHSQSHLGPCLTTAENVVHLAASLASHDLDGFWLPYTASHFTSAVTLLLRCSLQTNDPTIRHRGMESARSLVSTLRRHKHESNWDMADTALAQSETVLKRVEDAIVHHPVPVPVSVTETETDPRMGSTLDNSVFYYPDSSWQGNLEELFPEIFSSFNTESMLFDSYT